MRTILEVILNSLNNDSRGEQRGGMGHNWGKYFIGLFPVSEHLGHFKAIQVPPLFGKKNKIFPVFFLIAYLRHVFLS